MPNTKKETLFGGHAIMAVGYNADGSVICRNSWGANWGKNGYFTLPSTYIIDPNLTTDVCMVSKISK